MTFDCRQRTNPLTVLKLSLAGVFLSSLISCGDDGGTIGSFRGIYTVSGVISNLTADGLVLQLNGGNSLQVGADSSLFEFPVGLSDGQAYSITVKQNPASESCVIERNASGTISGADVTGVPIICSAKQFTVGGGISNLVGQGLLIQDQSSGVSASPAAGSSAYALSPFVSGQNYNIVVARQPTNPTQTCLVSSASGQVAAANEQDVTVTCTTQSFVVGGTVTGLLGSGLSLVDAVSGQTVSVPQTDSDTVAFSFPTPILSGSGYRVSVATQPIGLDQTCTVAGGGGTVAGASITNIAVTCLTNVYGVSGTIGGPAAHSTTGLVLTETVTGTQAVITGNSFTFPFPKGGIPDGSSFHISLEELESEQSDVTAHCLLDGTGANGTISGGDFTHVSVTCRFISSGLAGIGTGSQTAPGNVYFFGFDPVGGDVYLNSSSPTSDAAPTSLVSGSRGFSADPAAYEYSAPVYVANQIRGTITPFLISCQFNESELFPGEDCSQGPAAGQDVAVPTGAGILAIDPTGKNLYSTSGAFSNQGNTDISSFVLDSSGNLTNRVDTSFPGYVGWLTYDTPLPKILVNSTDDRVVFLPLNSGSDQLDDGIFSGFDVSLFKRSNSNGALTQENISTAISAAGLSSDGTLNPSLVPVDAVANAKNLYVAAETLIRDSGFGDPPFPGAAPSIVGYALTASGLSLLPGSPYQISNAAVDSESAILLDPSGTYLFLVTSSGISTFVVNVDGSLTLTPGSPIETVGVLGLSHPIIDPSGRFLYAAAVNTNNIVAYSINRQPTAASPALSVIGIYPTGQSGQLLMDNSGKFLYYLISTSNSEILGYFIDPNSGALRPAAGSPYTFDEYVSQLVTLPPIRLRCNSTTVGIRDDRGGRITTSASITAISAIYDGRFGYCF